MKRCIVTAVMLASLASPAWAETIHVGVNGLVCAFCVKGIEKSFSKVDAVETVHVDLDKKLVTLTTKKDQTLGDDAIKATITDAGYSVTSIHRME